MITDKYSQQIFSEPEICDLYMVNINRQLKSILCDKQVVFDEDLNLSDIPNVLLYQIENSSISEFDKKLQDIWFMPDEYKNMDIAKYVLDQCKTDEELQRAGQELMLYQERDMFILLKYMKYLVDTMRENNIIWGVGRGSSVASFVLYLINIHRINSLHWDLQIEEFLK
jgi:DNA polymerase III alpha subunit